MFKTMKIQIWAKYMYMQSAVIHFKIVLLTLKYTRL